MSIDKLVNSGLDNCDSTLVQDKSLKISSNKFYEMLDRVDKTMQLQLEKVFSEYTARAVRIAYIQGFKDYYDLCLLLNKDTASIINSIDKCGLNYSIKHDDI